MCKLNHLYDRLQVLEGDQTLDNRQRLQSMTRPLLSWYRDNARELPWRKNTQSYRVWISEIMLQQTRVEAVKPYFNRFMEELPDIEALAHVEEDKLLKLWEGLGYYSRARNLQKAAQVILADYQGRMPDSYEELLKLPGIGSYTAGAIASIAFGQRVPAVDGNVLRVIARVLADRQDIRQPRFKKQTEELLRDVMPDGDTGAYNQALIETGAILCLPGGQPRCGECPLESLCLTARGDLWREIPYRSPLKKRRQEERTVCLLLRDGEAAIRRRPEEGLLAGLYEYPSCPGRLTEKELLTELNILPQEIRQIEKLPESRHIFSHVEWHMTGYAVWLQADAGKNREEFFFVERKKLLESYSIPGALKAYTKVLKEL